MNAKMTVTLAMLWIGAMALLRTPRWIRDARDFISGSTGHNTQPTTGGQGGTGAGKRS